MQSSFQYYLAQKYDFYFTFRQKSKTSFAFILLSATKVK